MSDRSNDMEASPTAPRRPRWLVPIAVVLIWLLLGFFNTAQRLVSAVFTGEWIDLTEALAFPLQQSLVWALITPFVLIVVTRIPVRRGRVAAAVVSWLAASIVIATAKIGVDYLTFSWFSTISVPESGAALFRRMFAVRILVCLVTVWTIGGLYLALTNYELYRDREWRARDLAARLAQAQLQVLEMQLNPHFLFNTLQSIAELMHSDVEGADRMLAGLSELLRLSLSRFGVHEVSLREEIDFLRRYLAIEEIRFSDRLRVEFDIGPGVLDAVVPNLVLQPLVENALKHGVGRRLEPGFVRIAAHRRDSQLLLEVADNGPGLAAEQMEHLGLANTRARLEQLFDREQRFVLHSDPASGVRVEVSIPFRLRHEA
jgi:two-component system LytT family sensor kinase